MKIISNGIIPFRGFRAANLFGVVFVRYGTRLTETQMRHEAIHTAQGKELLWVGFYLLYVMEWLYRLVQCGGHWKAAYRAVSFEAEAFAHQDDAGYLDTRRHYAWARQEKM